MKWRISSEQMIDDVARSMTSDARDVELRTAVLARLDRRLVFRPMWLGVPVAVAALVVLAVGVRQPASRSSSAPTAPAITQGAPPPAIDPPAATVPQPALTTRARRTAAMPVPHVRSIAVLPEPRALSAQQIQPDALAIPLLTVKPIATAPLAINAIDDGSGGGR